MTDHDKLVAELRRLSAAVQKWSDRAWCEESVQASRRDPSSLGHPPSWFGGSAPGSAANPRPSHADAPGNAHGTVATGKGSDYDMPDSAAA